jgi:hypothetical protein
MQIRSYESWRELKEAALIDVDLDELLEEGAVADEHFVECAECDGSGEITDVGEKTGREFDTECPTCDGEGVIPGTHPSAKDSFTRAAYEQEVKFDLQLLAEWTHKPYWQLLFEAGFTVSFGLERQQLIAELRAPEA